MTTTRRARPHVPMSMHDVTVTRVQPLTPHLTRITFRAPSLADLADDGPDQRFKLLLPRPGQQRPILPDGGANWYAQWQQMPEHERPVLRTYTIRHYRAEAGEVDVDFVLHGDSGPASAWASRAKAGNRVGIYGAFADYDPPPDADWQLIVGDDTALPAIGAILDRSRLPSRVFVEVAGRPDRIDLPADVTWLHRDDGDTLLDAVRKLELPEGRAYAWVAGESGAVQAIRRHLVHDRALPRESITFTGYWRLDGAIDPN